LKVLIINILNQSTRDKICEQVLTALQNGISSTKK
jgi:hypothetical protein